ncbi:MAG TPA: aromatic amino acid lyase, partial [Pilimelia sp.]|nr:aromatic amino acid lyase [Pilimelia sp.]
VEDHVSMAPIAARHARQVVDNTAHVLALELMCGARALEFRRPLRAGLGSERLYGLVRRLVPEPEGDRPLAQASEALARWVVSAAPQRLADVTLPAAVGAQLVFDLHAAPMAMAMALLQAICDAAPERAQRRLERFELSAARRQVFID